MIKRKRLSIEILTQARFLKSLLFAFLNNLDRNAFWIKNEEKVIAESMTEKKFSCHDYMTKQRRRI